MTMGAQSFFLDRQTSEVLRCPRPQTRTGRVVQWDWDLGASLSEALKYLGDINVFPPYNVRKM